MNIKDETEIACPHCDCQRFGLAKIEIAEKLSGWSWVCMQCKEPLMDTDMMQSALNIFKDSETLKNNQ